MKLILDGSGTPSIDRNGSGDERMMAGPLMGNEAHSSGWFNDTRVFDDPEADAMMKKETFLAIACILLFIAMCLFIIPLFYGEAGAATSFMVDNGATALRSYDSGLMTRP